MKILVAPLNWGLGHATRCIPLIKRFVNRGDEVVLGGDGDSLALLKKHFPQLRSVDLGHLSVRYSSFGSQVGAMLRALPSFVRFCREDRRKVEKLQHDEPFDLIVSDNRFNLLPRPSMRRSACRTVYVTHQLFIRLPRLWRWLEPLADRVHAVFYNRYDEIWVPDTPDSRPSGELSNRRSVGDKVRFIGPLSRFRSASEYDVASAPDYDAVAVLSGPEPQRTLFEKTIVRRFDCSNLRVLVVQGKIGDPATSVRQGNITFVPCLDDDTLAAVLLKTRRIIARSGYTTVMDIEKLGLMTKTEFHPTPGQSEQEYLMSRLPSIAGC